MKWNPTEYLKTLHTKQLMNLRKEAIAIGGYVWTAYETNEVTIEQIKAELATREHVPNKIEAKALRQQAAKEKRNR